MRIFRSYTNGELREALEHVHSIAHVHIAEKDGDEIGMSYLDSVHPTVNRLLDAIPYNEPVKPCMIRGKSGLASVTAVLLESDGVHLVLDKQSVKPD